MSYAKTIVVIGGGIAGITCIDALIEDFNSSKPSYSRIFLISNSRLVKRAINYKKTGKLLEEFDIIEENVDEYQSRIPEGLQFSFIEGLVDSVDIKEKLVCYRKVVNHELENCCDSLKLQYDVLCVCIGSKPSFINYSEAGNDPRVDSRVIVLRDLHSVDELKARLKHCRRVVIIGNGGIGLELIGTIKNCDKVWIIKDQSIGHTFFDAGAAKFLLDSADNFSVKRDKESIQYSTNSNCDSTIFGPALGPFWSQNLELSGSYLSSHGLSIEYGDEVENISYSSTHDEYSITVHTKNKKEINCDLVVVAIGVSPNTLKFLNGTPKVNEKDGGILVDEQMRSSLDSIYAAGDVISCDAWPHNELWFQMRLWTQARQMGYYAGRCISAHLKGKDPMIYFNFECFTHCTSFFGFKFILLGRYNGQGLGDEKYELIGRVNSKEDYVKILVKDNGRIIGAVLVGSSGLEETIENLIHDNIDISAFKYHLLDNTVDIEDFFD